MTPEHSKSRQPTGECGASCRMGARAVVGRAFQPGTRAEGLGGWEARRYPGHEGLAGWKARRYPGHGGLGGWGACSCAAVLSLLLTAGAWANVVSDIAARIPDQPRSWARMCSDIDALRTSPRISIIHAGQSAQGRLIPCVAVHDPSTVFGETRRIMILGRQHGNESSGTEACMALIQHFATVNGPLEQETLRRITFIFVPMVNPDGATAGKRDNSRNVDLNRDWRSLSQPETIAVERLAKAWQPEALVDLHELPRSSSKPAYRENFIETIAGHSAVPKFVSDQTSSASQSLTQWLRAYGYRFNIYYDSPGRDRRLCHRHFAFDHQIPSYLFEAKTGEGRSLRYRATFHILGILVVANELMTPVGGAPAQPRTQVAQAAAPEEPPAAPHRAAPAGPSTVSLQYVAADGAEDCGEIEACVTGGDEVRYVKFYVDGQLFAVTNGEPYRCAVSPEDVGSGVHEISAAVVGTDGATLAQTRARFDADALAAGGR